MIVTNLGYKFYRTDPDVDTAPPQEIHGVESDFVYGSDDAGWFVPTYRLEGEGTHFFTFRFERRLSSSYQTVGWEWMIEREDGVDGHHTVYNRPLGSSEWNELDSVDYTEITEVDLGSHISGDLLSAYPESEVAGTFDVTVQVYAGGTPPTPTAVLAFDLRFLTIANVEVENRVFNPIADEVNEIILRGDFLTLPDPGGSDLYPNGWELSADIDLDVDFQMLDGLGLKSLPDTLTVSSPDSAGKVADFEVIWEGRGSDDELAFSLMECVIVGTSEGPGDPAESFTTEVRSRETREECTSCRCICECGVAMSGFQRFGMSIPLLATPFGPPLIVAFVYCGLNANRPAQSMGFGWASTNSIRVTELANGDLVYRDESGSFLRWTPDAGSYIPYHRDNYVEAIKDTMDPNFTYALVFRDQTRREFDSNGLLLREIDRNGNTTSYSYSGGDLASVTDATGRTIYYDYDGRTDGQPRYIRANDPVNGRTVELQYYSSLDLDSPNRLWKIIDPMGETTTFTYDPVSGGVHEVIDTSSNVAWTYTYDWMGRVETEQFYDQFLRKYWYDSAYEAPSIEVWEEDLTGAALEEGDPDASPIRAILKRYDERFNLIEVHELVHAGIIPTGGCDNTINITKMEYDDPNDFHLMTRVIDPNLSPTIMTYNGEGNLSTVEDSDGNVTTYEYADDIDNPLNPKHRNLLRKIHRAPVTVEGEQNPVTYDPTELQYDSDGNLVKIIDALGQETNFTVLSNGLVESITDRRWDGQIGTKADHTTVFGYDDDVTGNGTFRLLTITTPGGPDSAPSRTFTFGYDGYDNLTSVTDELGNTWEYEFDDNDRVTKITDARDKEVNFDYLDGLLNFIDAPANQGSGSRRKTFYSYDDSRRLTMINSEIDSLNQQMRVEYAYTGFSELKRLIRLKDSVPKNTEYVYDRLGRQLSMSDPLDRSKTLAHDPYCGLMTENTARGIQRKFFKDSLCRLTSVETSSEDHTYHYDELHRLVKVVQTVRAQYGQARYGQDRYAGSTERRFLYDELDRLVKVTFENGETIHYEYNEEGALTELTDVHGKVTRYEYYFDGRLHKVIVERPSQADRVFTYSYDLAGRLSQIEYPAETGIVAKFDDGATPTPNPGWNANGQLTHLRYLKNGAHLHSFEYDYDDAGNRKTFIDTPQNTANAIRWEYSYTWLNQLSEVKRGDGAATPVSVSLYAYDESDNRIELQLPQLDEAHTYTYNAADEIVDRSVAVGAGLPVVVETFSHDLDGNMTGRVLDPNGTPQPTTYTWNGFDRLIRIATPTSSMSNSYDTGGIRKRKVGSDGVAVESFYSGLPPMSERESSSGETSDISYLMGHQLLGLEQDGQFLYFITGGLSSVRTLVNGSGTVVGEVAHDEFGNRVLATGTTTSKTYVGGLGVADETENTELMYMRQRWYEPGLGRFLSQDPIGFAGGLNRYVYASSNPTTLVDPSGLQTGPADPDWNPATGESGLNCNPWSPPNGVQPDAGLKLGFGILLVLAVNPAGAWTAATASWTALKGFILTRPITATAAAEAIILGSAGYEGPGPGIPVPGRIPVSTSQLTAGEAARIQRASDCLSRRIVVVGSRAMPSSVKPVGPMSDFDYIIPGANSGVRHRAERMLPRGKGGGPTSPRFPEGKGIDIIPGTVDESRYHVIFDPTSE